MCVCTRARARVAFGYAFASASCQLGLTALALASPHGTGGDAKTFAAQRDDTYDKARDSKMYQGLLSFDELKKRKAIIESGVLEESAQEQAARALKADAVLAAKEEKARLERLEAKKRKTEQEAEQEANGKKDAKKEKKHKTAAVLSFTADDDDEGV